MTWKAMGIREIFFLRWYGSYQNILLARLPGPINGQGWQFSNNQNFCGDQEAQKIKERRREKRKKFFNFFLLDLIWSKIVPHKKSPGFGAAQKKLIFLLSSSGRWPGFGTSLLFSHVLPTPQTKSSFGSWGGVLGALIKILYFFQSEKCSAQLFFRKKGIRKL